MLLMSTSLFFFFNDTATTEIYTLSLHDALPIYVRGTGGIQVVDPREVGARHPAEQPRVVEPQGARADHAYAERFPASAHTSTPRWDPSINLRKCSTSGTAGSSTRARCTPWPTVRSELNTSR